MQKRGVLYAEMIALCTTVTPPLKVKRKPSAVLLLYINRRLGVRCALHGYSLSMCGFSWVQHGRGAS